MIQRVTISGFKSIEHMSLDLKPLNILIGANGAGKSNLLEFFEMLRWVGSGSFQSFVVRQGGADKILHWGAKRTQQIEAKIEWEHDDGTPFSYEAKWCYAHGDTLFFENERFAIRELPDLPWRNEDLGGGHRETRLRDPQLPRPAGSNDVLYMLGALRGFHFHDTSPEAEVRQNQPISTMAVRLRRDAGNLAAVLQQIYAAGGPDYERLIATIQQVLPWFRDFELGPLAENQEFTSFRWRGNDPDYVFDAHQLSDGALRAIALITLLLQARESLGETILIDEPELGLHPFAIGIVAALARGAAYSSQIVMATQSTRFLDEFDPDDVVVVDREGDQEDVRGRSTFKRVPEQMSSESLAGWLSRYELSELWEKNVLGGGPV